MENLCVCVGAQTFTGKQAVGLWREQQTSNPRGRKYTGSDKEGQQNRKTDPECADTLSVQYSFKNKQHSVILNKNIY